jgi:REP element-mobilizing transposase RayT
LRAEFHGTFQFTLHAYALMPNHVHLILEPAPATTVSRIMQCLGITYARYFNTRHGRVGHVFQGRFHSRLIDREVYLLVASRYVHLNPVRAKLVGRAEEWPWSSFRAYQDPAEDPLRLTDAEAVLCLVSAAVDRQRSGYRAFVEAGATGQLDPIEAWLVSDTKAGFVSDTVMGERARGRPTTGLAG